MSLFLTSDENVYGNDNTRTAFDNAFSDSLPENMQVHIGRI